MKYKVTVDCFGFRGQYWVKGTIVDVSPGEKPPRHFSPLESVVEENKVEPHRTEAKEMPAGKTLEVKGGMAAGLENQKLDRVLTTDKVPNNVPEETPKKRRRGRPKKS